MFRELSPQTVFMGLLVALTGFASSFAIVLQGLSAAGATPEEAVSGLMILSIAMGAAAILLSLVTRAPVSVAWSTPGAAVLAASGPLAGGFPEAVGAFLLSSAMLVVAGLWRPFGRAVAAIPAPLANAMLAGVLLGLCLAPFRAIAFDPLLGLPIVFAWIIVGRFNRLLAVPAALLAFALVVFFGIEIPVEELGRLAENAIPTPVLITPEFSLEGAVGIALPLFIVTMASQNIPGIAVLTANGYRLAAGKLIAATGLFSLASGPFGGHAVNLAAITAAMCAGEEAHADPRRRYWAAVISGIGYILFGLFAGLMVGFVSLAPSILIEAVAGLALIGAFIGTLQGAFQDPAHREAAGVTLLTTASGLSLFGIGGAFWGLVAGALMMVLAHLLDRYRGRKEP